MRRPEDQKTRHGSRNLSSVSSVSSAFLAVTSILSLLVFIGPQPEQAMAQASYRHQFRTPEAWLDDTNPANEWLVVFDSAIDEVRNKYPDQFVGARFDATPPVVLFKGDPPKGALDLLDMVGVEYAIRTDLMFSEVELDEATAATHFATMKLVPEGTDVSSAADPETAIITTTVSLTEGELVAVDASKQLTGSVTSELSSLSLDGIKTEFRADPSFVVSDDTSYGAAGGSRLLSVLSPGQYCTSGFVVKSRTSPDLGVLTAGHCANRLSQNGVYEFDFRAEHIGADGDIQWMRSPRMMDAWFHYDRGLGRPVAGVGAFSVGRLLYKFGERTGRTSSTVDNVNVCLSGKCSLVRTSRKVSDDGDSGGPWYYGNSAVGTHVASTEGIFWGAFESHSYFSPIGRSQVKFNVNLCIDRNGEPSC